MRDENLGIMEAGGYEVGDEKVKLKTKEELHDATTPYSLVHDSFVFQDRKEREGVPSMTVSVVQLDSLLAAQRSADCYKTAVLCFASTREPGGAFSTGEKGTQEEELCYRSTLGGFMKHQELLFCDGHFPLASNVDDPDVSKHIPNKVLLTEGVQVFRDEKYELLEEPYEIGVISCAAVVRPKVSDGDYVDRQQELLMRSLIRTQLVAAFEHNYDALILGAFGCGAFSNPPGAVAKLYKEILESEFPNCFHEVVFAILGEENSIPFMQVLT